MDTSSLLDIIRGRLFQGERWIWFVISAIASVRLWIALAFRNLIEGSLERTINHFALDLGLAVFILLFPYVFELIMGALPFQWIRHQRARARAIRRTLVDGQSGNSIRIQDRRSRNQREVNHVDEALIHLRKCAHDSRLLADKIFSRASVYLLAGVLIALVGLIFFSTYKYDGSATPTLQDKLISVLPRFGILFFIELIAFFFLRQYRFAMDEFRYYEAIKRRREENILLLRIMHDGRLDLAKLDNRFSLYSDVQKMAANETTDLLESKKLTKDETEIFAKMLDTIQKRQ
jgi:hypothetical protein